jgi:hypothetical protein
MNGGRFSHNARDEAHARAVLARNAANLPKSVVAQLSAALDCIPIYKDGIVTLRAEWCLPEKRAEPPYEVAAYARVSVEFMPVNE